MAETKKVVERTTAYGITQIKYDDGSVTETDSSGNVTYDSASGKVSAYGVTGNTSTKQAAQQQAAQQQSQQAAQTASADEASRLAVIADLRNMYNATADGTKKAQIKATLDAIEGKSGKDAFQNLDEWSRNLFLQARRKHKYINDGIGGAATGATNAISGITKGVLNFQKEAIHDIQGWSAGMQKALEPIGLCSALGDLTDIVKNPLGAPQFLANSLTSAVDKICPGFVSEMDNAFKMTKLDGLAHLPSKMMGSLRSLAMAADAILSVPFEIMSDIYNGLKDIMDAIADLIDAVVATVMKLAMTLINNLLKDIGFPVEDLLEFFSAVGDLASMVGGISQLTGGFSAVTDMASQVSGFASSANSMLSNPLGAIPGASGAVSGALGTVGSVTSALRNPEQFLPAGIKDGMQKISSIPGLGFVGNHGYSVGNILDTLSDGVFNSAIKQYSDKIPMIEKYFNRATTPPAVNNQENYPDNFEDAKVGPHQMANGHAQLAATEKVLANAAAPQKATANTTLPDPLQRAIDRNSAVDNLAVPLPEKPWLNNSLNNGTGPTIERANDLINNVTPSNQLVMKPSASLL